ncbi:MAG: hypothetical protein EOM87_09980 [Clostridia bacterium]|nr:hypothetical protein [Clostridia bacterium]
MLIFLVYPHINKSFFSDISAEMVYPIIPLYLTAAFGATPVLIGFIEGIAESLASLLKVFSGYITDIGMCGVREGTVLGVKAETVIKQFITGVHERFERGTGKAEINGVLFDVDTATKRCVNIKRIKRL